MTAERRPLATGGNSENIDEDDDDTRSVTPPGAGAGISIVDAGEYTRVDFQTDRRAVEQAAQAREAVAEKVRDWEQANSIEMARRLARMRQSDHWRGPGMKGNDREFCDWLVAEQIISTAVWAKHLLMSSRPLPVLEAEVTRVTLPTGATQIRALGSAWYMQRPQAIVNVWTAAVEEAGGQPSREIVAAKARRYKADLQSVEDSRPGRRYDNAGLLAVKRQLRAVRKKLDALRVQERAVVEDFVRDTGESWGMGVWR